MIYTFVVGCMCPWPGLERLSETYKSEEVDFPSSRYLKEAYPCVGNVRFSLLKNEPPCSLSPGCPFQYLLKTYEGLDLYFYIKEDLGRYHNFP